MKFSRTASSVYKGFPTFRTLTPFPSSGCAGCLVAPKYLVVSFGAIKPPAHIEDWDEVSARNFGKPYILTRLSTRENYVLPKYLFFSYSLYSEWTR